LVKIGSLQENIYDEKIFKSQGLSKEVINALPKKSSKKNLKKSLKK